MAQADLLDSGAPVLTKEQRIGFVLLSIFAVLAVGLGILQIRNTMYAPFALNNKVSTDVRDQVNSIDALRYRDTDHDGLSDFDELYVYGTSPYLYDTFGYGMSDKEVIARGLPLCPRGDCSNVPASGAAATPAGATATTTAAATAVLGPPPPDVLKTLSDPIRVRQMLLQSGTDKKLLDKISDHDLMLLVQQLLASSSTVSGLQTLNEYISTSSTR